MKRLLLLLLLFGCIQIENKTEKVLFVIAPTAFADKELFYTKEVIDSAGIQSEIASTRLGVANGELSGKINVSKIISEVDVSDYDAIIFIGGPGVITHNFPQNSNVLNLAKKAYNNNKIVAAICIAPRIIANAGLLIGKNATVFPALDSIEFLQNAGANYINASVVVDGKIITANGPLASEQFGETIVSLLKR